MFASRTGLRGLAVSKGALGDPEEDVGEVPSIGSCKARTYWRTRNRIPGTSLTVGPLHGWRATFLQV